MSGAGDAFIVRTDGGAGEGPRVAVKDLVDVAGIRTTCGCRAIAEEAEPAARDAVCVRSVRSAGARIVGKTALHEIAFGVTGVNPWYGTPENPLDPTRVPGGSSSGSAVAVARGEADVAIGTDTGGSVRIPAACCGVVGLKTSWGSLSLEGVRPLAPSFDTVGPLASTVAGATAGYELLTFAGAAGTAGPTTGAWGSLAPLDVLGTFTGSHAMPGGTAVEALGAATLAVRRGQVARLRGLADVDEQVDAAVDAALARAGIVLDDARLDDWGAAFAAHRLLLAAEAYETNQALLAPERRDGVGEDVVAKLERGAALAPAEVAVARQAGRTFTRTLLDLLAKAGIVALPTIPCPPPLLDAPWERLVWLTAPVSLTGFPALALPVLLPKSAWTGGRASLQLVGPPGSERQLLDLGARVEAAQQA